MKQNKKMRLIGLSAALMLLVVIGIGGGVWYFRRGAEEAPAPEFSQAERTGVIKEGEIYQEETIREFPHPWAYGNIVPYSRGGAILRSDDSEAWMEDMITGEVIQEIPENWKTEGWLWEAAFDGNDVLYGAVGVQEEIKIFCLAPDGTTEEKLQVNFSGKKVRKFLVDEFGCYFVDENSNLEAFLWNGQRCLQLDHVRDIAVDGQGTLYVNRFEPLEAYQMPQAEKIYSSNSTLSYGMQIENQMAYEKNLGLLYINGDSFTQIFNAENGSFLGTAMRNGDSAPSMDRCAPGFYVDGEQNMYCTIRSELTFDFMDDRKAVEMRHPGLALGVYRYQIVEDRRDEMPYTLTVTGPYRSEYMARVIQQFELEHPGQRVKYDYEYASQQDFYRKVDQDGYFDRMNLRILSGDVGDLVMTGGTWSDVYHYFANTDLFEDLTPWLENSQSYPELDPVLLNSIKIEGKIKGVPLETDYYYVMIDSELCQKAGITMDWQNASWGDVLDLLTQLEGTDCYLFEAMGDMQRAFTRMLISNMPDLIDRRTKEVDLRQDWFIELIEKWKKAEAHPNFCKKNFERGLTGKGLVSIDGMTSRNMETDELYLVRRLKEKTGHTAEIYPLFCGEKSAGRTATGADLYSIYAASEQKEAAQQLLEIAIRQDLQQVKVLFSGPLNQAAREKRIQRAIYWSGSPNQEVEEFYRQFERIYTSVDTLYDMNKLKEDLWRPLWDYVEGQKTLDQALEQAEQNLRLRLYE